MTTVEVHDAFALAFCARTVEGLRPLDRAKVLAELIGTAHTGAGASRGSDGGSAMQTLPQAPAAAGRERWAKSLLRGRPREPD